MMNAPYSVLLKASMSYIVFSCEAPSWVTTTMPASMACLRTGSMAPGSTGTTQMASTPWAMRSWMTWACMVASVSAGPFWKTFMPVSAAYLLTPVSMRTNHGLVASLGTTAIV